MIALLVMLLALQAPPTPAPPPPAAALTALPADPREIARSQFIAFASGDIVPSLYSAPPEKDEQQKAQALLLAAGRMKNIELVQRADARLGTGYVFRFTCEHGTVLEKFTAKGGKITSIAFTRA